MLRKRGDFLGSPLRPIVEHVAARYHQRPSALVGLAGDPALALDFDMAMAVLANVEERVQNARQRAKEKHGF